LLELLGFVEFNTWIWAKKMGRRRWGEELIGGFSSPHALLPKEEKEEKNVTSDMVLQKECRKMTLFFLLIDYERNFFKNCNVTSGLNPLTIKQ
jgi:hypothetical protein